MKRAEEHRQAASAEWSTFLDGEPYWCAIRHNGQGNFTVIVNEEMPPPPKVAMYTGEWLYNLRCAIDYAAYATAILDSGKDPPPMAGQLQFPVALTEKNYRDSEYRLKPISQEHKTELIEFMQPFRHPDPDTSALWWLHKLARIDRHRRLTMMMGYLSGLKPVVRVPQGCTVEFRPGSRFVIDGEAEIVHFAVNPWRDGWGVQVNPRAGLEPEIAESDFWRRIPYNERLQMLAVVAKTVVVTLEYACTGESPQADLLMQEFRDEWDARRI